MGARASTTLVLQKDVQAKAAVKLCAALLQLCWPAQIQTSAQEIPQQADLKKFGACYVDIGGLTPQSALE
eukprot:2546347-Amphidinium_carterae.1